MISLRPAVSQDASSLAAILLETGWFSALNVKSPQEAAAHVAAHLELCLSSPSHTLIAAELDGEVCGYLSIHWLPYLFLTGPEGFISELFVAPKARGLGLGGALLERAVTEGHSRGCSRLSLLNGRHRDSYLRSFYERQGWEERPIMANFILPLQT